MAEYTNMLQVLAAVKKGELLLADVPEKFKTDTVVRIALELHPLEQTTEVVSTLIPPAPATFNEEIKDIVDELLKEEEVPANVNEVEFAELMEKIENVDLTQELAEVVQEAIVEVPKAKPELTLNAPKHQKNYRR